MLIHLQLYEWNWKILRIHNFHKSKLLNDNFIQTRTWFRAMPWITILSNVTHNKHICVEPERVFDGIPISFFFKTHSTTKFIFIALYKSGYNNNNNNDGTYVFFFFCKICAWDIHLSIAFHLRLFKWSTKQKKKALISWMSWRCYLIVSAFAKYSRWCVWLLFAANDYLLYCNAKRS